VLLEGVRKIEHWQATPVEVDDCPCVSTRSCAGRGLRRYAKEERGLLTKPLIHTLGASHLRPATRDWSMLMTAAVQDRPSSSSGLGKNRNDETSDRGWHFHCQG
jgi:hypothetical protein